MDNIDSLFVSREDNLDTLRRIDSRISVNLEGRGIDGDMITDIANQCRTISNEAFDRQSIRQAFDLIKGTAATAVNDASNFVSKVAAALDSTGKKELDLIRKRIYSAEGDLATSEVVIVNKSLAEALHVDGRVPDDPMSSLNKTLMFSSYIRTTVLPAMSRGLNKVDDDLANIEDAEALVVSTDAALADSLQVKSLLDFFKQPSELLAQFPGGYALCRKSDARAPETTDLSSTNAKSVQAKIKALYGSGLVLNNKVSTDRAKASAYQVPLLTRDEAQRALNVVAKVIGEADGLLKTAKGLKKVTAKSIRLKCKYYAAMEDGQVDTLIEKLDLMADYYNHSLLSHDVLLTSVAAIMHKTAKAYLQLITTSINHYR